MALALPLLGAAAGGILTSGAGWAISAGWLIGSWVMNATNKKKNQIFDPGAEEMPTFNQALRGATIAVTFGTNRVSTNIVWQKNFTTIRHEKKGAGGGGKFGGSGMGAKGGGGGTGQDTYEYKWDLLAHAGMSFEPVSLYGGWLGADRLNSETLLAIINNSSSGYSSFFLSNVDRPQNASLSFDEAYFFGAQPTSDTIVSNWPYFETQEGGPYRWPYTFYVGFKQLNLGEHAVVPQLSWEIGPGDVSITFSTAAIDIWSVSSTGASGPRAGLFLGNDGVRYQLKRDHKGAVRNIDTQTTLITISDARFNTDAVSFGLDNYNYVNLPACIHISNSNYFLVTGYEIGLFTHSYHCWLLYEIDSTGNLNCVGGYEGDNTSLVLCSAWSPAFIYGQGTEDDPIFIIGEDNTGEYMLRLPSINQMKIGLQELGSNQYGNRLKKLNGNVSGILDSFFPNFTSYRPFYKTPCFALPTVNLDLGLPNWGTTVFFYIGRSDAQYAANNPADNATMQSIIASTPNGGIWGFTVNYALGVVTFGALTNYTSKFTDRFSEAQVIPFADSGYLLNETTQSNADDYDPTPQVQKLTSGVAAGATLLCFWKNISYAGGDRGSTGAYTRLKAFLWNPFSASAAQYFDQQGAFANSVSDWGVASSDYTLNAISGWYNEAASEILVGGEINGLSLDKQFADKFGDLNVGGGADVYPPYIIKAILTDPVIGAGLPSSVIDQSSYELALQYCVSEGIKVSVQYRREENLLSVITELLSLYGGYLIDSGGVIKFGLQEFASSTVRTIDNDHLLVDSDEAPVQVTKGARQDVYNKVKVNYFDRDLEYRQNFVEVADEVDIDINGLRPTEFAAKFVMSEATANKIAIRTLWSNLYNRDQYTFKLGPKDADLEPGDVITLVDSFSSTLRSGKQARIVVWEERSPMKFNVTAVEEIEYITSSSLSADNASETSSRSALFGPAYPPAYFSMYELPKEFQTADGFIYVGWRQQSNAMGAHLFTSADGTSYALSATVKPYIISGILAGPLPDRDPGYMEESVEVYLMPDTRSAAFNPNSPTYCQTFALDDVQANGRALGAGAIFINSEMMAYQGVTLVAQNRYRFDRLYRGWGGTHIQGHSSGDTWFKHGAGVFATEINQDKIGSIIYYKVAPFNFAGVYYDVSSIDARTYQIQGTYWRPQNGGPLHTYVQSPGSFLTIQSEDLGVVSKKRAISGGSPVQIEWPDASRDAGYGAQGYGTGGYGRFTTDTTSTIYRVEVLSSDLSTVVRCTTVSTTAFLYSVAENSSDFNGWNGSFAVKVTPRNDYGDALRSRTKILELFA